MTGIPETSNDLLMVYHMTPEGVQIIDLENYAGWWDAIELTCPHCHVMRLVVVPQTECVIPCPICGQATRLYPLFEGFEAA